MGLVPPVIGNVIVHLGRIPDRIHEKAYRIFMKRYCLTDQNLMGIHKKLPVFRRHCLACRPVHNLPPFLRVVDIIRHHLFSIISFHKRNSNTGTHNRTPSGHEIQLLALLHMFLCKCIVSPGHKIRRVNLCI